MRTSDSKILKGIKHCSHCHSRYFAQGYNTEDRITMMMDRYKICYDCAYWQNIINYPPKNMEIIGNKCMIVLPFVEKKDKSMLLGGQGKKRFFARYDLSLVCSNDVWSIGTVPEIFRGQLKSTLFEINEKTYNKIKRNGHKCSARGCFDRYHCLRYSIELEKDHIGEFNKIPPAWRIGNEHCPDFIDMFKFSCDESSVPINK